MFEQTMLKYKKGNLITMAKRGDFDVIAHGCNCFCQMGSGIAKDIKKVFSRAYTADCTTKQGDSSKLGSCTFAEYSKVHVVNMYTQYRYGRGGPHVRYDALRDCMIWLRENYSGLEIGLPKIGCGLAGGSWGIVEEIINEELIDHGEDVTVVIYV